MSTPRTRGWYWKTHGDEYHKRSMANIDKFVGWPTLMELIEECEHTEYRITGLNTDETDAEKYRERLIHRDKALIAALFLTGGRVNEVVPLRKSQFEIHPLSLQVRGMRVLKRYKKLGHTVDEQGRKHYVTETIAATRGIVPIRYAEPLVPVLLGYLKTVDDFLFPSPVRSRDYISGAWAYQIVTSIGERLGVEVWPHWFRSQRASQLATEYSFDIQVLADWFKWSKLDTARIYTKLDPSSYEKIYAAIDAEQQTTTQNIQSLLAGIQDYRSQIGGLENENPNST